MNVLFILQNQMKGDTVVEEHRIKRNSNYLQSNQLLAALFSFELEYVIFKDVFFDTRSCITFK